MPRRGLPDSIAMRHDEHYVEALAASAGTPVGRMVAIDQIDPNPNQPRQVMGDLSELIASISEKGIIEPLIVRQRGERFQIIAGERRYQAAVQAGIRDLPVIVREVDDAEVIELALIVTLFSDGLLVNRELLVVHWSAPVRALLLALPLTMCLLALCAKGLFAELSWAEAFLLAAVLVFTLPDRSGEELES